ncbi:MAG: hypothetical protein ACRYGR_05690 [Janthinobacterium lividum]
MNRIQWTERLVDLIKKDAFKFTCLHLGRLLFCVAVGYIFLSLCQGQSDFMTIVVASFVTSIAVVPSFKKLLKHYAHVWEVFLSLILVFIGYVCMCVSDMINIVSHSSYSPLNQVAWQFLFIAWGLIEFYVCRCPKTFGQEEKSS